MYNSCILKIYYCNSENSSNIYIYMDIGILYLIIYIYNMAINKI